MEEGLKLIKAEITNFKNISHKEVRFEGKSAIIIGKNGAGKSSLIQAIMSPVNSKVIPDKPIKDGEERASIELQIGGNLRGEDTRYNISMYFSPENQRGRVVVTNEDGDNVTKSKSSITDLMGDISFDIMDFINMGYTRDGKPSKPGIREQIEILKRLMPQEVIEKLHTFEREKKEMYDSRTEVNREAEYYKSLLEGNKYSQEDIEKYSKSLDATEVQNKIKNLSIAVENHSKISNQMISFEKESKELEEYIADLEKRLADKKALLSEIKEKLVKGKEWLSKNEKPEMTALTEELSRITEHNEHHKAVADLENKKAKFEELKSRAEKLTQQLVQNEKDKKDLFSSSVLPVQNLEFDDEQILYKGLPLSDKQIPTSTLIGIGCKIGMAMNPNLRLMVIKDGSLLDKKTLEYILKICESKGYQLLIEMVDRDGGDLSIEFVEK
jgi:DNA repair exonuclease SbcCD ATPase subunit